MKWNPLPVLALASCLASLCPGIAHAEKVAVTVAPKNAADSGFVVTFRPGPDANTVTVRLARDTARSQPVNSPDLMLRRSATLRVWGDAGLLLDCPIEPREEKGRVLLYEFILARSLLANAHLTVAEIDDYKAPGREHLIGGGTFYELPLADFQGKPAAP